MKFISAVLLTALAGFAISLYLWWWSFAVTAFIVAVIVRQTPFYAFLAGFTGMALLWGIQAAILSSKNDWLLAGKVASLLPLNGSGAALLLLTALLGGLIAGMAALTGNYAVVRKQ